MIGQRSDGTGFALLDSGFRVLERSPTEFQAPWYRLRVLSVEHTGTHFLDKLLRTGGFRDISASHWGDHRDDGFVISPIRRPEDVYRSWVARGRMGERFWFSWLRFNERYEAGNVFVLPVDTPDREKRLEALSERLRTTFTTDWEPVGCGPKVEVPDIDLSGLYALPVVRDFYE